LITNRQDSLSVGGKDGAFHGVGVSRERLEQFSIRHVPKAHRLIVTARQQGFAIRGEADAAEAFAVAIERAKFPAGIQVPNPYRSRRLKSAIAKVIREGMADGHQLAVGRNI